MSKNRRRSSGSKPKRDEGVLPLSGILNNTDDKDSRDATGTPLNVVAKDRLDANQQKDGSNG